MLALALGACLAPTLPIPPPTAPEISAPDADGLVTIKGGARSAQAASVVFGCNLTAGCKIIHGIVANGDGSWQLDPLPAQSKDLVELWQEVGNEAGERRDWPVP
jgi:hypothetical protein